MKGQKVRKRADKDFILGRKKVIKKKRQNWTGGNKKRRRKGEEEDSMCRKNEARRCEVDERGETRAERNQVRPSQISRFVHRL